jgi:choline-sulfatase
VDQPNILLIMCDQLAPQFTGAYGHSVVQTPHLDQLAAEGVRFDAAYTSCPLCAPARHSLMSGQYISRIKCWDNSSPLASDTPTVAHYLSAAGYETVLSGKMHFVGPDQLHGFEKRLTTDIFPSDYTWLPGRPREGWANFGDTHAQPIAIDYVTAGPRQWSMQLDFDEEVHFRALEYLRGKRSLYTGSLQRDLPPRDARPFFLCVSYSHPHEPFHPTPELWDLYSDAEIDLPEIPQDLAQREHPIDAILNAYHGTHRVELDHPQHLYNMRRAYYAQTTYIDRKVGELLQALDAYGLRENTLVVFISDHGEMLGERRMIQKRSHYEYSARVPWIIAHPSVPGGVAVPEPVSLIDLLPTLLACAGIDLSEVTPIDGRDVSALMAGERNPDRVVFCESHAGGMTTTTFMVRQGEYKYILAPGYPPQLYDLVEDPREWQNLADDPAHADIATRLRDLILAEFDPAQIDSEIEASLARRRVIRRAMKTTHQPRWDYQPVFDATQQYWRSG